MKYRWSTKLLLLVFLLGNLLHAQAPKNQGFIHDFTSTLSAEEERALEDQVQEYFQETGIQLGVAIEESLNGKAPFDRAMELSRNWGVGAKNEKRGLLIYIAKNERKYHITVAQTLQADLTDGITGELARNYFVPELKNDRYFEGIQALIQAIKTQITSPDLLVHKPTNSFDTMLYPQTSEGRTTMYILVILLIINLYFGLGKNLRSRIILNKRAAELGIEIKPWHK